MIDRTGEVELSSAGLLLLLFAAAMTLFTDHSPNETGSAKATAIYRGFVE